MLYLIFFFWYFMEYLNKIYFTKLPGLLVDNKNLPLEINA